MKNAYLLAQRRQGNRVREILKERCSKTQRETHDPITNACGKLEKRIKDSKAHRRLGIKRKRREGEQ